MGLLPHGPPPQPSPQSPPPNKGLYASADEGSKKLASEYEYWSGKLTEISTQMCFALIGANWVVFGSMSGILKSNYAKYSLILVFFALGANVIRAWMLSEAIRKQLRYSEGDLPGWEAEYQKSVGKSVAWPFTKQINKTGMWMRRIKLGFTLASGILFIVGAVLH